MSTPRTVLILGDNRATMRLLADGSVDAVVCDPPYGLGKEPDMAEVLRHWLAGDDYTATGGGFMSKTWDSFVPGPATWREVARVLKPGGHLLAFAGSRTFDVMGLAIRLAGFEIRDGLSWLYGSGFPKSLDVSKAIDKAGGTSPVVQAGILAAARERAGLTVDEVAAAIGCTRLHNLLQRVKVPHGMRYCSPVCAADRVRFARARHLYGLTPADFVAVVELHGDRCAICGQPETRKSTAHLAIDHDHATGKVRGLLCSRCNTAIGLLDEDPDRMAAAARYVAAG